MMDGIDRIDRTYRVDPAGHGPRRRRDTDEEFREFLEREREEREREERQRGESSGETPAPPDRAAPELPADIVDIRLRTIHNFEAVADFPKSDPGGEIEKQDASGDDEMQPEAEPLPPESRRTKIDEIV